MPGIVYEIFVALAGAVYLLLQPAWNLLAGRRTPRVTFARELQSLTTQLIRASSEVDRIVNEMALVAAER